MKSIIEVKDLSFRYKEDQGYYDVNNVSFHVKRGEWLSIVGHNGSGKSTTIRLIDGLLEAESGEIWIDGQLLSSENVWDLRRQIGMVFQNPDNQFVGATVEDDVAFGLENQGLPREEMKKRVAESLERTSSFIWWTKTACGYCGSCCPEASYFNSGRGYKYVGSRGPQRTDSDSSRDSKRPPDDSRLHYT